MTDQDVYLRIDQALSITMDYDSVIKSKNARDIIKKLCSSVVSDTGMVYLPLLTIIAGLMSKSTAITHRTNINFQEPNILWTCVAAEPGKKLFTLHVSLFSIHNKL